MIETLSVFLPAFNEEGNIESTVRNVLKVLKELRLRDFEVIVVDDGSADKTSEIVEKIRKDEFRVKLVRHDKNRGYGGVLKTGFRESKFPWVAFTDADGQFDFSEIKEFLKYTQDAELIIGFRKNRADSFIRRVLTFGWKMIALLLLGINLKDYSCGFKLIKKQVFDSSLPLETEEKVTQIELLVKARNKGFRVKEIGVNHYPRKFGTPTGASVTVFIKSVLDLIKLKFNMYK